jgi:hypothetical protein
VVPGPRRDSSLENGCNNENLNQRNLLVNEIKELLMQILEIVKRMEERQLGFKEELKDAPAMKPTGSFATGYQKPD